MDEDCPISIREAMLARDLRLELEHDQLHRDIAKLGVANQMHLRRIAELEQEIKRLKNKLATCTEKNQNLREELSEAYRMKSQLADLPTAEVSKNAEALKFFQGCVAAAFAERDNAVMEAKKAKEREKLMPQELKKSGKRVEELTAELLEEKEQTASLRIDLEEYETQMEIFKEVIDKFYNIRQCSLEDSSEASWEEKCECLMSDSNELWRFQNEQDISTSNYIMIPNEDKNTWQKPGRLFINKCYNRQLKFEIYTFSQKDDETLSEAWERFNELVYRCQNHGIHECTLMENFYHGVRQDIRGLLDTAARTGLLSVSVDEAKTIIEGLAASSSMWPDLEQPRKTPGMLELTGQDTTQAQVDALSKKLQELERQLNACPTLVEQAGLGQVDTMSNKEYYEEEGIKFVGFNYVIP